MTKKKVAKKVAKKVTPKVTPKKPIVADAVTIAPTQLGFFARIWVWLKNRIKYLS